MRVSPTSGLSVLVAAIVFFLPSEHMQAVPIDSNLVVNQAAFNQTLPAVVSDASGGAIMVWEDGRNGGSADTNHDIYAQHVDNDGTLLWGTSAKAICTKPGSQGSPAVTSDGAGGAIIVWEDTRSGQYDLFAQRVNSAGSLRWAADGILICSVESIKVFPEIVSDGAGGAIVLWQDLRNGSNFDLYAQRIDSTGTLRWASQGVAVCTAANNQSSVDLVASSDGGIIAAWEDYRALDITSDIYTQKVNKDGVVQWNGNGVRISSSPGYELNPAIASDNFGGAYVVWEDRRSDPNGDLYAQRVLSNGTLAFDPSGVAMTTAASSQVAPRAVSDGVDGVICVWNDYQSGNSDIYAQRLLSTGITAWSENGVSVCSASGNQLFQELVSMQPGSLMIVWQDYRTPDANIYSQTIDISGIVGGESLGHPIAVAPLGQEFPKLAADPSSGAVWITWQDKRGGSNYDIYAQHLSTRVVPIVAGWNLLSVPLMEKAAKTILFPSAISSAFAFSGSYVPSESLSHGVGYWLKFPSDQNVSLIGSSRLVDSVKINPGWNMIGGVSATIPIASIIQVPDGIISSDYFLFDGGYAVATELTPFQGYWVRAQSTGTLIVSGATRAISSASHFVDDRIERPTLDTLIVQDARGQERKLFFTAASANTMEEIRTRIPRAIRGEQPPLPPLPSLDVRFSDQCISHIFVNHPAGADSAIIVIQSDAYPLKVSWATRGDVGYSLVVSSPPRVVAIVGAGSTAIDNPEVRHVLLVRRTNAVAQPAQFSLLQNYPNPFNPVTQIQFALSEDQFVTLKVFDALGEEVATLVNQPLSRGYYSIPWNATAVSSGTYFYKIQTPSYTAVRKMLLLR